MAPAIKDMIISGGLNIYPSEVEDVLYKHSAVEECSVVGMPHPEYEEAVTAYVIKKQGRIWHHLYENHDFQLTAV